MPIPGNNLRDNLFMEPVTEVIGPSKYPTRIDLCDGKYTIVCDLDKGQMECLRYGEKWRDLCGDKMVLAMFDRIVELQIKEWELIAEKSPALVEVRRQLASRDAEVAELKAECDELLGAQELNRNAIRLAKQREAKLREHVTLLRDELKCIDHCLSNRPVLRGRIQAVLAYTEPKP